MFVMLARLKASLMNCSFCSLKKVQVLVRRRSNELKSSPKFRFGFTCPSVAPEWHGTWLTPVHGGRAFQLSMAALCCVPLEISRPRALRGRIGSRVLRAGTNESMGTCEAIVQMGEIDIFQGTSKTPK